MTTRWEYQTENARGEISTEGSSYESGLEAMKNALLQAYLMPYIISVFKTRAIVLRNDKLFWRECDDS